MSDGRFVGFLVVEMEVQVPEAKFGEEYREYRSNTWF
jgi:protein-S-isoprenylcysteine O-methyltransferase Ste14